MNIFQRFTAVAIFLPTLAGAQADDGRTRHIVYGELATFLLGTSGAVNYEYLISPTFSIRGGYGIAHRSWGFTRGMDAKGLSIMANRLIGKGPHRLELGGGISLMRILPGSEPSHHFLLYTLRPGMVFISPAVSAGYRYQHDEGGFFWRAGLTAIFLFGLPVQVSVGYAF